MKESSFIKKPVVTVIVIIIIAIAIFYLKSQQSLGKENSALKTSNEITNIQNAQKTADKPKEDNVQPTIEISQIDKEKASKYPKAPDFAGIDRWINSEPLKIEELKGKVVLVDFWTYTCINCIRTLPYLKEWDAKYRDKGLVIVGVHTPEFEFEKKYENVLKAVNDYQIKYPVAQDNDYGTWGAYQNRYWPHEFLIDIDGYIRHDRIGEGEYDETEKMIQSLLKERMERLNQKADINETVESSFDSSMFDFAKIGTPEIYFGYQFTRGNIGYENIKPDSEFDYSFPVSPLKNYVYLSGKWKNNADNMELAGDEGSILLIFQARNANIVAGSEQGSNALVYVNDKPLNGKNKGSDIKLDGNGSSAAISGYKLYDLVSAENYSTSALRIDAKGKGFRIYTFTFG